MMHGPITIRHADATILTKSGTLSTSYMFRPLVRHHQVVFNLSINYTIYVVYSGRGGEDEISFTIVSGTDSSWSAIVIYLLSMNLCH